MELLQLKTSIINNTLSEYYIFTGTEVKVREIYLKQMAKVKNAEIKILDNFSELVKVTRASTLLRNSFLYVIFNEKDLLNDNTIQDNLLKIRSYFRSSDNLVVFVYDNIDNRLKFVKEHSDDIVNFSPLTKDILQKYITRDIDLNSKNCDTLIEVCESDYGRILMEIDKIQSYMQCTGLDANKAFVKLLDDGVIYIPPQDAVFDFVDAVLKYKTKLSFQLLEESYSSGENTLVLLTNLYNNTKWALQYQSCTSDDIQQATGLTAFQIKLSKDRKNRYHNGDLVFLMKKIREIEKGIKIGEIEDCFAVELLLVNLWC